MQDSDEFTSASNFYESMLVETDEANILLDNVCADGPGRTTMELEIDNDTFKKFLSEMRVSENVIFTSAFAYTLSRFAGGYKVIFNIIENSRDRFNNFNSIGMYVNTLPLLIDCKNQEISSFMEHMSNSIYSVMKYNYYPFRILSKEYDINSSILFQFLPEWIDNDENNHDTNEIAQDNASRDVDSVISDFDVNIVQREANIT